jgi:hypothetical protein
MGETTAPFLLSETGCVQWQARTLRQLAKDEHFLETVIGENPQLLCLEDRRTHLRGRYLPFHQLRLQTPQGRTVYPDLVFLCESGHVAVVEVKLADNPELADRRVVAQVLDYAASMAAYEEEDLVELFGGDSSSRFVDVVRSGFPGTARPEELAEVLLERMRSAELHLVIACDGAPDGLREFVRGVTNQSAVGGFELRVVELVPHTTAGIPGVLLLPSVPVRTEIVARTAVNITYLEGQPKPGVEVVVSSQEEVAEAVRRAQSGIVREMRPALAAAVAAYDAIAAPELRTRGRSPNYRQIKPAGWPGGLHYELLAFGRGDGVGVELHLEGDGVQPIAKVLEPLAERLQGRFPGLAWDPQWYKGRLVLRAEGLAAAAVAETMKAFIGETRSVVDAALRDLALST